MASNRIKGLTVEIGGDTTKLGEALKNVEKKSKSLSGELSQINRLLKLDPTNTELLAQKHKVLTEAVATTKAKLDKLREAEASVQEQFKRGDVSQEQVRELQREIIATERKMETYKDQAKEVKDAIKTMGDESENTAKDMDNLGDAAKNSTDGISRADVAFGSFVGTLASRAVSEAAAKLRELGQQALQVGMEFTSSMSEVAAISGATGAELAALEEAARKYGATSVFSAAQCADALKYMAMAGWKTNDMLSGMEGIVNLAAASGEDLATVSDIVTDALTAFGLQAKDSAHFSDVLAAAANNANTNVTMLGGSFKYVAPVAGALGYSIEDVSVALGLMANSGIKAEQAGTSLRSMLSRLAKPTKEVNAGFEQLGISATEALTNADGSMRPLSETIQILREKMAGLDESTKASVASSIAGQEAMSGLLAIVGASEADFRKLTKAIDSADGTAQAMADTMQDNLSGDLKNMGSAAEEMGIKFYKSMEQPMRNVVKWCTQKLIPALTKFGTWVGKNGPKIVSTLAAVTAGTVALKTAAKLATLASKEHTAATLAETLVLGKATIAQKALALAQQATPWGLVATVAASAAASLIAYSAAAKAAGEDVDNLTTKERELVDAGLDAADALREQQAATQEAAAGIVSQFEHTEQLAQELMTLADASGNVQEADQARANVILGLLNDALGTEYTMVNGQIQAYDELKTSVEELIETKRMEALMDAYKSDYTEALKAQKDAANAAAVAYKDYAIQQDVVNEKTEALTAAQEAAVRNGDNASAQRVMQLQRDLDQEKKSLDEKKAAWEELSGAVDTYSGTIRQYEEALMAAQQGDSEEVQRILSQEATAYADHADNVAQTMERTRLIMRQAAIDAGENAEETRRNWENGVEGYTEDMVKEAEDSAAKMLAAYDNVYGDAESIGKDFGSGMISGMESKRGPLYDTVGSIVQGVFSRTRAVAQTHSPSKRMAKVFEDIWAGGVVGTEQSRKTLLASTSETIDKMMSICEEDARPAAQLHAVSNRAAASAAYQQSQVVAGYSAKLDAILSAIQAGQVLLLDGNTMVGGTINEYNARLGGVKITSDRNVR